MDRISYIEHFATQADHIESSSFIRAFVRCLDQDESVALLLNSMVGKLDIRGPALRKVCSDIQAGKVGDPSTLIDILKERILRGEPRRRETIAYCLLEVARACNSDARAEVQGFLSASRYIRLRRRGYKLYQPDLNTSRALLEQAWLEFNDREAAWLIAKTFPLDFLTRYKNELRAVLTEGWQLSRLYLRLAVANPESVEELLDVDSISYVYVQAKRGQPVSTTTLTKILEESLGDARLGLLLWCMGELKQWDQLVVTSTRMSEISHARFPEFATSGT